MTTPATYPLVLYQGSTFDKTFTWKDANGAAVNLTGYTARMKMAQSPGQTALVTLTTSGGITLGGSAGTIRVQMSAADTAALTWESGVYDLEVVSGGGIVTRLLRGPVRVDREVTT